MADAARTARSMWTLFEPIHAVTYFSPEARSAFEQAGLRGFWRGYFAGRAAPLGAASAAVVTASFFNFSPAFVARAIPGVWALISPADALAARAAGAAASLRGLFTGLETEAAAGADLLWRAIGDLDCPGRVLAAANAALPDPDPGDGDGDGPASAIDRLWQAATVAREHRGDGHFAALAAAGFDGCEAVVLRCGLDLRREDMQPIRGWTDEQWEDAQARLADRGLVSQDGKLTSEGLDAHAAIEDATDRAAARPWTRLGEQRTAELRAVLTPLAQACASLMWFPSPIGVPAPGTVV
jgi:helix-turn-helix protein